MPIKSSYFTKFCLPLASSWFLAWYILLFWRWNSHVPPKCRLTFNGLQSLISQKKGLFFFLFFHRPIIRCVIIAQYGGIFDMKSKTTDEATECNAVYWKSRWYLPNPEESTPSKTGRCWREVRGHTRHGVNELSDSPWSPLSLSSERRLGTSTSA
jgi:hypothetical protein